MGIFRHMTISKLQISMDDLIHVYVMTWSNELNHEETNF